MKRLLKTIDAISRWSGQIACYLALPGMFVLVYEVGARYIFNAPTIWAHGVTQRIFAVYLVIGAAFVLSYRGHINMEVLYNRFSPRTKAIVDVITAPLLFALIFVLLWHGSSFAWTSLTQLEPCNTPFRAPVYPIKVFVPLTGFLLLLQGSARFFCDLFTAITGRQYEY